MNDPHAKNELIGSRSRAIVAGIVLLLLGLVCFFFPLGAVMFVNIFIVIGLFIYGVYRIIGFIKTPAGHKDGWQLAIGIAFVVCSLMVLASEAANILLAFAFMLAMLVMLIGIHQIMAYTALRGLPGAGLVMFSGILNILLAVFLIIWPFTGITIMALVQGAYLCVAGITLIIEGVAKRPPAVIEEILDEAGVLQATGVVVTSEETDDTNDTNKTQSK